MHIVKKLVLASALLGGQAYGHSAIASEVCEAIRAELQRTPIVIGNPSETRLYASAITRQDFEIRKTRQNMLRLGCSQSISVIDQSGKDVCAQMETALAGMEANKRDLMDKRQQAGAAGGLNPRRQQLMAALEQNRCDSADQTKPTTEDAPRPYATPTYPEDQAVHEMPPGHQGAITPGQGFRTMCVRTCDGSFFPISAFSTPANFAADAAQCQRQCPGAETELYYHSLLTQEAEEMVSTSTGRSYRDMPFAFAYRNRQPGSENRCSCTAANGISTPQSPSVLEIKTAPKIEKPVEAAAPAVPAEEKPAKDAPERPYDPTTDKVRQVGPKFLPAEEGALDLQHPALPGPQPVQP
ncbi:DUF2865 domain-containing protein [Rhizobium paknamense]|uniref:DUF2865 domain-containing protein n=1 Tax=Rhizobium paknamense TaxID=1206817 RepID=A0ABU0ICH4_9HYPH|nr:DUF2865 domain-containing protein [Rhizobium paknamense]MDQ0455942.1 hypothetical protein [Rhizobium paknamense]